MSDDGGMVVLTGHDAQGPKAWRWTAGDGAIELLGTTANQVNGISGDGHVAVGSSANINGQNATRWSTTNGLPTGLGDLPGGPFPEARAVDASFNGAVIVGSGTTDVGKEAFRWTAATDLVGIGDLDGGEFASEALAVTGDGTTIVGWATSGSGREAFRWTADGGMEGLGDLPGGVFHSEARGISADGSIIVGIGRTQDSEFLDDAFIWTEQSGMLLLDDFLTNRLGLDLGGWSTRRANAISADGTTIVGYATHETLGYTAYVAVIPTPASAGLLSIAGLTLVRRRR